MTEFLETQAGRRLAYRFTPGRTGHVFTWLSGFKSDMQGTKVLALEAWARGAGHGFLAFDYSGHGQSSGAFEAGTISDWRDDTLAMLDAIDVPRQILVGSSMGGWMALLAAQARPALVNGLVLIAPAPDFTSELMWPSLPETARDTIEREGHWQMPSDYDAPVTLTRALFEDGARHRVLDAPIRFDGPVRILQGMQDPDVPWRHAQRLVETLTSPDLVFTLVKDGDHRLSRPSDIARLVRTCGELADAARLQE